MIRLASLLALCAAPAGAETLRVMSFNVWGGGANEGKGIEETVAAGAAPAQARKWWTGEIARIANTRDASPAELVSPLHVSELIALVESGDLTDRLARQVLEGVIEGEGRPAEVVEARGLKVV